MQDITFRYLSQEDLLTAGAFDFPMAMEALRTALRQFEEGDILFPAKTVQIFNEGTQERINCLPATLLKEKICGMKWVSVFPQNPARFGCQNLSAILVLSHIEKGYPVCVMDGTLCSNLRVAAMGATAASYLARQSSESIGFIGAGEQAKMHLLGMKAVRPSLRLCRVAAKTAEEEQAFIRDLQPILPEMEFAACGTRLEQAVRDSDIVVTATSAQAPLLKAAWLKPGAFYSHIGGWEDEYQVVTMADKLVCDDWETVKHRTQTVSRCYREGLIGDDRLYANIGDLTAGRKPGREREDEFTYFNAVGLSYVDIAIALAMYRRAEAAGCGRLLPLQESLIFEKDLRGKLRL